MKTAPDTELDVLKRRVDVLSADEEGVLAELREVVNGARDEGGTVSPVSLRPRITSRGASVVAAAEEDGTVEFSRAGVRFLLRAVPGGAIEVCFPAALP
jgi:hypothetical protein